MVHGEGFEPSSLAYRASGLPLDEPWELVGRKGIEPFVCGLKVRCFTFGARDPEWLTGRGSNPRLIG